MSNDLDGGEFRTEQPVQSNDEERSGESDRSGYVTPQVVEHNEGEVEDLEDNSEIGDQNDLTIDDLLRDSGTEEFLNEQRVRKREDNRTIETIAQYVFTMSHVSQTQAKLTMRPIIERYEQKEDVILKRENALRQLTRENEALRAQRPSFQDEQLETAQNRLVELEEQLRLKEKESDNKIRELEGIIESLRGSKFQTVSEEFLCTTPEELFTKLENAFLLDMKYYNLTLELQEAEKTVKSSQSKIVHYQDRMKALELKVQLLQDTMMRTLPSGKVVDFAQNNALTRPGTPLEERFRTTGNFQTPAESSPQPMPRRHTRKPTIGKETAVMPVREEIETTRTYHSPTQEILNSSHESLGTGNPYHPAPTQFPSQFRQKQSTIPSTQFYQSRWENQNRTLGYGEETSDPLFQRYLISNCIPDPPVFNAELKTIPLKTFQHSFEMKFRHLPALDQIVLLQTRFLSGKALKVFNGIPDREKSSAQSAFDALGERLRVSVEDESRTAKSRWERLKIREGQSVEDYCLLLDEVAERAFSRISSKDVSSFKTSKLLNAMTDRNEDVLKGLIEYQLRNHPEEEHYEECRKFAIVMEQDGRYKGRQNDKPRQQSGRNLQRQVNRTENVQRMENSLQTANPRSSSFPQNNSYPNPYQPPQNGADRELTKERSSSNWVCRECGLSGSHTPLCSRGQAIECFNCFEKGHYASKCPRRRVTQQPTSEEKEKVNAVEVTDSNVEVKKENTKIERGPCSQEYGKIGKSQVMFLIDSGSGISIIAQNIWKRLVQENGAEWENALTKQEPTAPRAFAANNTVINLLFQVSLETTMTTRTREVVYQVADADRNCVIIGTNAFETMDISMNIGGKSRAIKVMRDITLEPGTARTVEVQVEGLILEEKKYCLVTPKSEILSPTVCQIDTHGKTFVQLTNFSNKSISLEKGWVIASGEMEDFEILVDKLKIEHSLEAALESERLKRCVTGVPDTAVTVVKDEHQVNNVEIDNESRLITLFEHLEKGEKIVNQDIRKVINQFHEIFAINDQELGRTHRTTCEIILQKDAQPIRQKPRPIPLAIRPQIKKMIYKMIDQKVIRESQSPWASPIVLVKKKDGSVRMCIDYRKVNKVVVANAHPLPHIEATLQSLSGKKVFSTLDLLSGYWQVPLKEESRKITAFAIGSELYEWNVLPFGLNVAPAIFQSTMEKVLGDSLGKCAHVYIDDLLIASDTIEQHVHDLREILWKIKDSGMKLRANKCCIARGTVEYLGHQITPGGVQTDDKKVERMRSFPRPVNAKELHSFLGLVGYYQKFILNFSKLASPLTPLTSKKSIWKWEVEQEDAFQKLKQAICEAPVLVQPDVDAAVSGARPFLIYTDASRQGVGAVLAQENELGEQHPIAFSSKALSPAEKNYHVTDLEALAMMQALKRFKVIIYGTQVVVYTDHRPLVSLLTGSQLADRLLRWSVEILAYNVKIIYIPGKANTVADILSRGGCPAMEPDETTKELSQIINSVDLTPTESNLLDQSKWIEWLKAEDVGWKKMINKLENGEVEGKVKIKSVKKPVLVSNYAIIGNTLRNTELPDYSRIVVPECAQKRLISEIHDGKLGGHFSAKKMLRQINQKFFWPKMYVTIEKHVNACSRCLCTNDHPKLTAPLTPYKTSFPLEVVACDLVDIGLSTQGNRYLLTIIDLFSKYATAVPIPDKRAETVVKAFIERWAIGESRIPQTLLTDQGKEFGNSHFAQLAELLQFNHVLTKGYNSRANGCIERFNKTIVHIMKKKASVPFEWDEQVPFAVFAYNAVTHQTTGDSPNFLMNGRDSGNPIIMKGEDAVGVDYIDPDDYKHLMSTELLKAHKRAKEHSEKEWKKYKVLFDEKFKTEQRKFPQVGSRVLVEIPSEKLGAKCPKLVNKWKGPYRVLACSVNSATVTPVLGKQKGTLKIPYENLRVIPIEMDDTPIETVKNRRQVTDYLGVNDITVPDHSSVSSTNLVSNFSSMEIYHCRCPRTCNFTLPGQPAARTTSPTQLVRMASLVEEFPELLEKDNSADLLMLSQHPEPRERKSFPDIAWKALSICPTIFLVLDHTALGRELQAELNTRMQGYAGRDRWANAPTLTLAAPLVEISLVPLDPAPVLLAAKAIGSGVINALRESNRTTKIMLIVPSHLPAQLPSWKEIVDNIPAKYPVTVIPAQVADEECGDIHKYAENLRLLTRAKGELNMVDPSLPISGSHRGRALLDVSTTITAEQYYQLIYEINQDAGRSWTSFKLKREEEIDWRKTMDNATMGEVPESSSSQSKGPRPTPGPPRFMPYPRGTTGTSAHGAAAGHRSRVGVRRARGEHASGNKHRMQRGTAQPPGSSQQQPQQ